MAGPGAPSRPPPAAPHRPACRGARLTQGPAPGDIASRELAGRRCAPLLAPPPDPLRPPEPTDRGSHLRVRGSGVERCGEREAPRSQRRERRGGSEHRARARRRRRSLGARARAGAGRTCVCCCVGAGPAAARGAGLPRHVLGVGTWCKEGGAGPLTLLHLPSPLSAFPLLPTKTAFRKSSFN